MDHRAQLEFAARRKARGDTVQNPLLCSRPQPAWHHAITRQTLTLPRTAAPCAKTGSTVADARMYTSHHIHTTHTCAPLILPFLSNWILMNFPKRDELSFLSVTAFPKLSSRGLQLKTLPSRSPTWTMMALLASRESLATSFSLR